MYVCILHKFTNVCMYVKHITKSVIPTQQTVGQSQTWLCKELNPGGLASIQSQYWPRYPNSKHEIHILQIYFSEDIPQFIYLFHNEHKVQSVMSQPQ
jgi:hypothetical protein